MLKQFDFTKRPLRENLLTENIGDLFDGNPTAIMNVCSGTIIMSYVRLLLRLLLGRNDDN